MSRTLAESRPLPQAGGRGIAMLVVAALGYGANIPYARLAADLGVPGTDAVAARVILILPLLALAAAVSGVSLSVPRGERRMLFLLGFTTSVIGLGYLSAIAFVPVGVAVMIFYTFPLLILLAAPFVDKVRLSGAQLIAFALAFTGIALAIGPSSGSLDWRGLALAGMASAGAACQFFLASRAPGGGGLASLFWIHAVVLPVTLAVSLFLGGPAGAEKFSAAAFPLGVTTALYIGAIILQIGGMRLVSASLAGVIFCLEPVVATLSAGFLLGERLSGFQYAGGALVLGAIILNLTLGAPRAKAAA